MSSALQKQAWPHTASDITAMAIGRNSGKIFATGESERSAVKVWALGIAKSVLSLENLEGVPQGLTFNLREDVLAGGDDKGAVKLWSLREKKVARSLQGGVKPVSALAFHPSGSLMVTAGADFSTRVWDLRQKNCIQTYSAHEATSTIRFSPDGNWIVSGGSDGVVKTWDLANRRVLSSFKKHRGPVSGLEFHPSELVLATSGHDGSVNFWDLEDSTHISTSGPHHQPVRSIAFAQDGSALVVASDTQISVMGWKPFTLYDAVDLEWGGVSDICIKGDKLVASSYSASSPSAWLYHLNATLAPFAKNSDENTAPPAQAPVEKGKKEKKEDVATSAAPNMTASTLAVGAATKSSTTSADSSSEHRPEPLSSAASNAKVKEKTSASTTNGEEKNATQKQQKQQRQATPDAAHKAASSESEAAATQKSGASGIEVPSQRSEVVGLSPDDFRSRCKACKNDAEMLDLVMSDHLGVRNVLAQRLVHVRAAKTMWDKERIAKAMQHLSSSADLSVAFDMFSHSPAAVYKLMDVGSAAVLLPVMHRMLQSDYEDYVVLAGQVTRRICKTFGSAIRGSVERGEASMADAAQKEKAEQCRECHSTLQAIGQQMRENLKGGGRVAQSAREVLVALKRVGV